MKNNKIIGLILVLAVSSIMLTPIPVMGKWTEDFSTETTTEWQYYSSDWSNITHETRYGALIGMEPTFEVDKGNLLSSGIVNTMVWQGACRDNDFTPHSWTLDVKSDQRYWAIQMGRDALGLGEDVVEYNDMPFTGYYIVFNMDEVEVIYFGDGWITIEDWIETVGIMDNHWTTYQFILENDLLNITRDGELMISRDASYANVEELKTTCLVAKQGDGNRYDNVTIAEKSEYAPPVLVVKSVDSSSEKTPFMIDIGIVVVIIGGNFIYTRRFKK